MRKKLLIIVLCYLQDEIFAAVLLDNHFVRLPPENYILSPKRDLGLNYEEPFSAKGTLFFFFCRQSWQHPLERSPVHTSASQNLCKVWRDGMGDLKVCWKHIVTTSDTSKA